MPLDGGNSGQMVFRIKANLQDLAVGWLPDGRISHGGGMVVRFPRIWMLSGECRLKWSSGKFRFERAGGDQTLVRSVRFTFKSGKVESVKVELPDKKPEPQPEPEPKK